MTPSPGVLASTPLLLGGMGTTAPSDSLRRLTEGLARGEDAAWAEFHRSHGPAVFRQLLAATRGDHALASEALQAAYLRIARHVRACDAAPMFESWLRVVARTALSDCRRRHQTWWQRFTGTGENLATDEPMPSHEIDARLLTALDTAMQQIEPSDRALLEAKYLSQLSVRDIAARLSLSEKAVESRLTRARAAVRSQLTAALARHEEA